MIIEKLQAAARLLARKRTAASGIPAREHFASEDSASSNFAAAGCNFAAAGSGTDSTAAGTIIDDQPAWDRPVLRQPASRPTRRKAAIVATPEEAEALIADPSDDVARQALAKAKVRTAKSANGERRKDAGANNRPNTGTHTRNKPAAAYRSRAAQRSAACFRRSPYRARQPRRRT